MNSFLEKENVCISYWHIYLEIIDDKSINFYMLFWILEIVLASGQGNKNQTNLLRYILTMVTSERTVTTEAAVATTISRAPAVRIVAEEKIYCPPLHLKLGKIRLQLKDNVRMLLYISIKEKIR